MCCFKNDKGTKRFLCIVGNEMNKFLNENWRDVSHDLGPAVSETISVIVTSILKGYFTKIPYDEIFLP